MPSLATSWMISSSLSQTSNLVQTNIYASFGSQCGTSSLKINCIFPKLNDFMTCPRTNRWEETVMSRLHTGHPYVTHSFSLTREELPMCTARDDRATSRWTYLTVLFWSYWDKRGTFCRSVTADFIAQHIYSQNMTYVCTNLPLCTTYYLTLLSENQD